MSSLIPSVVIPSVYLINKYNLFDKNSNTPQFSQMEYGSSKLWCTITTPAQCALIEKDMWVERKTKDAFKFKPLNDDMYYNDTKQGVGAKAIKGQVVRVRVTYRAAIGGKKLERWLSLKFVLGKDEFKNVPAGLHVGIEGMRVGGRRIIVIPSEMTNYRFSSPVFAEVELLHVCEFDALSLKSKDELGQSLVDIVLSRLHLIEVFQGLTSTILGYRYTTEENYSGTRKEAIKPAETEDEFFDNSEGRK